MATNLDRLRKLRDDHGLSFDECVEFFGVNTDDSAYANTAEMLCESVSNVEFRFDDFVVVNECNQGDGAYVMAWIWVDIADLPETMAATEQDEV